MKIKINCITVMFLLAFFTSGCVEISKKYHGNAVSSVNVVTLQEKGASAGRWETFDLVIDYEYIREGDDLELSAQVALGQHQQRAYENIRRLDVYLFFLDENSRVLETVSFVGNMFGSTEELMKISRSYKTPAGTAGISFGYDGVVTTSFAETSFYQLPLNK